MQIVRTPGQSAMLPGAVRAGAILYTSGIVAPSAFAAIRTGAKIPAEQQIGEALEFLVQTLRGAGAEPKNVLKVEAFLSSADLMTEWNSRYLEVWPMPGPARTTLIASFTSPVIHFEVQAIAAVD